MPKRSTVVQVVDFAAAHSIGPVRDRFLEAAAALDAVPAETIKSAVRSGSAGPILDSDEWSLFTAILGEAFLPEDSALAEAVIKAARETTKIAPLKGLELDLPALDKRSARWMRRNGAQKVVQIQKNTEKGIQRIMSDALRGPEPRRVAARRISKVRGLSLTDHQAKHLQTWITNQAGSLDWQDLSEKEIQHRIQREYQRRVNNRARVIGHTESYDAGNAGVTEAYEEAVDQGLIKADSYVLEWVPRGGPCPRCAALAGKWKPLKGGVFTSDPVASGQYKGQIITIERPTVHPHCYCTVRTSRPQDVGAKLSAAGEVVYLTNPWVEAVRRWVRDGGELPQIAA